ncbi:Lectin-like protein BA14k [Rhizobiaceae bacterium]|nr:Lectin-like protein BA14k [Rhizobiaceae bacterium]
MKRFLSRLGLIGLVAAGAMGAGVAVSSAQCLPGSTDCPFQPPYTLDTQPGPYGDQAWRPGRHHRPDWRIHRDHRPDWRHHRDHRRDWRRTVRRGTVTIGIWGGPFYDDYWDVPQYRYVEPAPRYKVIHLSAAHVDWCYKRYKTYRASDNTYKPTKHTRRQCISPFS